MSVNIYIYVVVDHFKSILQKWKHGWDGGSSEKKKILKYWIDLFNDEFAKYCKWNIWR